LFKRFLIPIAVVALSATVHAEMFNSGRFGLWETSTGTNDQGKPMCSAAISDSEKYFAIKVDDTGLFVHFVKWSWNIPDGTPIKVIVEIDHAGPWNLNAVGMMYTLNDGKVVPTINFTFDMNEINPRTGNPYYADFFGEIKNGRQLNISFPNGNETPWVGSLRGSSQAMQSFSGCMGMLATAVEQGQKGQPRTASQPFSKM
jgi:hypothetical protein